MKKKNILTAIAAAGLAVSASAQIQITEWMYSGANGEFIEFTNLGPSTVDFSSWSYDDDSRLANVFDLSGFGSVTSGESVVITESTADAFRTAWGLSSSVKVLGGYTNNLGRDDEINLYDGLDALVDRLTYGDNNFPGTVRTQNASASIPFADLGSPTAQTSWVLSTVGDAFGSYASTAGDKGNPGLYLYAIPEPSTVAALAGGVGLIVLLGRRRGRQTA